MYKLYSQRKKEAEQGISDVYIYDKFCREFRNLSFVESFAISICILLKTYLAFIRMLKIFICRMGITSICGNLSVRHLREKRD